MNSLRSWLDGAFGFLFGLTFALFVTVLTTDVDTPVANEPKCETIIIHRR